MTAEGPALRETPEVDAREGVVPRSVTGRRTALGELPPAFEDRGHR